MADAGLSLLADGREDLRSACGSATIAVWHLFQMYQTAFERGRHRLCAVVDSELAQNVGDVGFYRARTQEQGGFDFEAALQQWVVLGSTTNAAFLLDLIAHPAFIAGETHTGFLNEHFPHWQSQGKTHILEAAFAAALSQTQRGRAERSSVQAAPTTPWQRLGGWRVGS